jgi:predicted transcriptional regulator
MVRSAGRGVPAEGLFELRRSGSVTELLFLYECATLEPTQLRPVADRLGLTVQAVSHSFRQLRGRGLVEVRSGRYRPTVEGVAWLHESLGRLGDDVRARVERLHVIRSCRAVALADLARGDVVSLELRDGRLSAQPGGAGASRGTVATAGRTGTLVEVTDLEGIVPLSPAPVTVRTLSEQDLYDPALARRLARVLPPEPGLLAAEGLEALHSLERATDRPVLRFAVATASIEASQVGVPSTVVVLDRDLPHLLSAFSVSNPPPLDVRPLPPLGRRPRPVGVRGR